MRRRWSSPVLMVVRALLGTALLIYVLRSGGAWTQLTELLGVFWLVALLNLIPLVGAWIEATRLGILFGAQRLHLPLRVVIRVVAIGALFNLWIPGGTGGDVMKLYYFADRHAGRVVEVATILIVDRVVALFALLVFILALLLTQRQLWLVPMVRGATVGVAGVLAVMVVGTAIVWSSRIRASAIYQTGLARLPLGHHLARAANAAYRFRDHKAALLKAALLSMTGHALLALSFAISGTVLVPGVPIVVVGTLSLLGLLANVLPVTPGGLGVGEAASEALFRAIGVPGGASLIAAWRVGTFLVCLLGAAFYIRGLREPARASGERMA